MQVVDRHHFARAGYLRRALDAGIAGYLLKDAPVEQLADALRKVHRGGRVIDPQLAVEAWTDADRSTIASGRVLRLGRRRACGQPTSRRSSTFRRKRSGTTCPKPSASSAAAIASRLTGLAHQKGWL